MDHFSHPLSKYSASPLSTLFNKRGFIRTIDLDLLMSDLAMIIDEESLVNIIKLKKRVDSNKSLIDSVEISFSTTYIRRTVSIINYMFKVNPIIIPPRCCFKCQMFPHTLDHCRSTHPMCEYCSECHESEQCRERNPKSKCNNCKGNHFTSSNLCPRFKYEFQVARVSYLRHLNFLDAKFWLAEKGIYPPTNYINSFSYCERTSSPNKIQKSPPQSQPHTFVTSSPLVKQGREGFKGFQ